MLRVLAFLAFATMKLKKRGKGGTRDKADPRYTNIRTAAMQLGDVSKHFGYSFICFVLMFQQHSNLGTLPACYSFWTFMKTLTLSLGL